MHSVHSDILLDAFSYCQYLPLYSMYSYIDVDVSSLLLSFIDKFVVFQEAEIRLETTQHGRPQTLPTQ